MNKYSKALVMGLSATALTLGSVGQVSANEEKVRWKVQAVFGTHLPGLGDPIKQISSQSRSINVAAFTGSPSDKYSCANNRISDFLVR